ncbi:MAG: D-2-hydroxyacid dehydrogenase [Bacteroidales bacterium]|nr:D-2-hydroxyacid dehydrogenase [Bacteroidales bacterium]
MKIVILEALTLGDDIDLSIFKQFGNLLVYQTTNAKQVFERIEDAEIVITNKVNLGKDLLQKLSDLKLICVAAAGYNNIDIECARKQDIVVTNVKNYSTEAVAQHTFSLILALQNSLINYAAETRSGNWSKSPIFTMLNHPFYELNGKKIGILGYGAIGKRVAEIANAFGMQVLIGKRPGVKYTDIKRVEFNDLLAESDVLTLHTPLSESTRNLLSINEFRLMKPSSILINVARGGIVKETDLFLALKDHIIRGAAIDVCEKEPIQPDNKLTDLQNILITPHIAWASLESRKRLIDGIVDNIRKYLLGEVDGINIAKN